MKDIMSSKKISDFLQLATNVVKYNAAYLDEDIIASIVLYVLPHAVVITPLTL